MFITHVVQTRPCSFFSSFFFTTSDFLQPYFQFISKIYQYRFDSPLEIVSSTTGYTRCRYLSILPTINPLYTFPIVITREDGASCDEIKLGGSFEQSVKPRTVSRRGYIDRYFSVACEKEVDQLRTKPIPVYVACYSLRVSRATACCSRYADIRMSLSRSRRIFRSWSATGISGEAREYYVWATSMDTCNSLLYRPLKLLCAPWFNTRRHCLRLARLFILSERGPKWIFLLDFVPSRWEDECCAISFFFLHALFNSNIFRNTILDQRYKINFLRLAKIRRCFYLIVESCGRT